MHRRFPRYPVPSAPVPDREVGGALPRGSLRDRGRVFLRHGEFTTRGQDTVRGCAVCAQGALRGARPRAPGCGPGSPGPSAPGRGTPPLRRVAGGGRGGHGHIPHTATSRAHGRAAAPRPGGAASRGSRRRDLRCEGPTTLADPDADACAGRPQ